MRRYYFTTKKGKEVDALAVNAALSTIYSPRVPKTKIGEGIINYKRGKNNFNVILYRN